MRYRAFADECRALGLKVAESGDSITFVIPMPKSWSKKKKRYMNRIPHQQKPDVDNLLKSLLDAVLPEDCKVWHFREIKKRWGSTGKIIIERNDNGHTVPT